MKDVETRAAELRSTRRAPHGDRSARVNAAMAKVRANTNLLNVRRSIEFTTRAMEIFAGVLGVEWAAPLTFIATWSYAGSYAGSGSGSCWQMATASARQLEAKLFEERRRIERTAVERTAVERTANVDQEANKIIAPPPEAPTAGGTNGEGWLRVTEAAARAGVSSGQISRAVNSGKVASNGKTKAERRVRADGPGGLAEWINHRSTANGKKRVALKKAKA
jgi:hypothetical protein